MWGKRFLRYSLSFLLLSLAHNKWNDYRENETRIARWRSAGAL
jgi:hypothetical protein